MTTRMRPSPASIRARNPRQPEPQRMGLGFISARYESGGRGVGFISSGQGDPGGASYGIHQLSGRGSMPAFLRSPEGRPYADQFRNTQPMTREFNRVYSDIAARDPQGFAAAQQAFYTRTHYEPVRLAAERAGLNVADRGVQEALFSMSIQHGRARDLVARAAGRIQPNDTPAMQVRRLYETRAAYVANLGTLPERTRVSVLNRYEREVRDALALAGQTEATQEQRTPQGPMVSPEGLSGEPSPRAPDAPHVAPQSGSVGKPAPAQSWPAWAQRAHFPDTSVETSTARISPVPPAPPSSRTILGDRGISPLWSSNAAPMQGLLRALFGA